MSLMKIIKENYRKIKRPITRAGCCLGIAGLSFLPSCFDQSSAAIQANEQHIQASEQQIDGPILVKEMPVLAPIQDIMVHEGEPIGIMPIASDPDGGTTINYSFTGPFTFTLFDPLQNLYVAQTDFNSAGTYVITVTASNSNGNAAQNVNLTVNDLQRVLYQTETIPGAVEDIKIMFHNNAEKTNLTFTEGFNRDAVLSPDGLKVAFVSDRDGQWDVYVMDSKDILDKQAYWESALNFQFLGDGQGDNLEKLTQDFDADSKPSWTPDNAAVVFQKNVAGNPEIFIHYIGSAGVSTNLSNNPSDDTEPNCSNNLISFVRDGNIFTMNYTGGAQTQLTTDGTVAAPYSKPKISPDETKIVSVKENSPTDRDIRVMDINGSNIVDLSSNAGIDDAPTWKADGTRIAYHSSNQIFTINPDGTQKTQETYTGNNQKPIWGPGNGFTFQSDRINGTWDVFRKTLDDGYVNKLTKETVNNTPNGWR